MGIPASLTGECVITVPWTSPLARSRPAVAEAPWQEEKVQAGVKRRIVRLS
jgi:hypothetical protein